MSTPINTRINRDADPPRDDGWDQFLIDVYSIIDWGGNELDPTPEERAERAYDQAKKAIERM